MCALVLVTVGHLFVSGYGSWLYKNCHYECGRKTHGWYDIIYRVRLRLPLPEDLPRCLIQLPSIATASAAYNALKKGIEIGRELQDMSGQLAAWAGAVSDLDFIAKKAEDPPWWRVGPNVQAEAMEIFAAKRKIQAQRDELKTFVQYSYGQSGVGGVARLRPPCASASRATDHRKAEIKEMLITITIVTLVLAAGIAGLALLAYLLWASQQP
jgi:hypothetical protein